MSVFYLRRKLQQDRPRLQVDDGVLHRPLVVFAHVLVHVRVVGADVLLRAAVGHRAELQGRVLLLRVLELVKQREVRGRGRQEGGGANEGQETQQPAHLQDRPTTGWSGTHKSNPRDVAFRAAAQLNEISLLCNFSCLLNQLDI